jgi:Predicted phosphoesterase
MTVALFSDIHGNITALDAVLDEIDRRAPDAVYCLGDLVGYGASPNEVVETIRTRAIPTIMGNYDDGVGFDREECGCAYTREDDRVRGDASLKWTRAKVTDDNKRFLQQLAPQLRIGIGARRVLLVHGSPRRMNEYLFEDRPESSFQRLAEGSEADLIAFGHTHKPYVKAVGGVTFLNIGSVGKPKDGDPRACVALVTESTTEFVRVPYDIATAAAAIRATTLPEQFARDIETGGRN